MVLACHSIFLHIFNLYNKKLKSIVNFNFMSSLKFSFSPIIDTLEALGTCNLFYWRGKHPWALLRVVIILPTSGLHCSSGPSDQELLFLLWHLLGVLVDPAGPPRHTVPQ